MRKVLLLFIFELFFFNYPVFAHPPTDMKLSYDSSTHILHIEMRHVVSNVRNADYIRRLLIYKNGEEPISLIIVKQTTPTNVVQDVSLQAVSGDVIKVEAISSRGGSAEETLTVPEVSQEAGKKQNK